MDLSSLGFGVVSCREGRKNVSDALHPLLYNVDVRMRWM